MRVYLFGKFLCQLLCFFGDLSSLLLYPFCSNNIAFLIKKVSTIVEVPQYWTDKFENQILGITRTSGRISFQGTFFYHSLG